METKVYKLSQFLSDN